MRDAKKVGGMAGHWDGLTDLLMGSKMAAPMVASKVDKMDWSMAVKWVEKMVMTSVATMDASWVLSLAQTVADLRVAPTVEWTGFEMVEPMEL